MTIADRLKASFHDVEEKSIEAAIVLIEIEDGWLLVRHKEEVEQK